MSRCTCSPLDSLETAFRLLSTGPQPLALEGRAIGLRRASIGLWELRPILFHPATGVASNVPSWLSLSGGRVDVAVRG